MSKKPEPWIRPSWQRLQEGDEVRVDWLYKDAWDKRPEERTYKAYGTVQKLMDKRAILSITLGSGQAREVEVDSTTQFEVARNRIHQDRPQWISPDIY